MTEPSEWARERPSWRQAQELWNNELSDLYHKDSWEFVDAIARALDQAREEGSHGKRFSVAYWHSRLDESREAGRRAGIEEAAKVTERYVGLNPVADDIRALLSPGPEGEK